MRRIILLFMNFDIYEVSTPANTVHIKTFSDILFLFISIKLFRSFGLMQRIRTPLSTVSSSVFGLIPNSALIKSIIFGSFS